MEIQQLQFEIEEWLRSAERKWMVDGEAYYRGDHDVLKRKREAVGENGEKQEIRNLANNRLVHAFIRKLVDQKIGYTLGRPFSIQTKNKTYESLLEDFFDKAFLRLLKNVIKDAVNKGRAWLQVYYNEQGLISFKRIPAEEILPFWKDAAHTELESVLRIYTVQEFKGTKKEPVTKVEHWHQDGTDFYAMNGKTLVPTSRQGHLISMTNNTEQAVNWERIPFVCFKYNDEEIPLLKFLKSLIDDYDRQKSDNANSLEDIPNSVYVLKNYDGEDLGEFRSKLHAYRAVKVSDEGSVDTLNVQIDTDAHRSHIDITRKDIYEFGRGVDTQSEKFGNSPSGIALKFLYADLDMDANNIETEFQASFEQLLWFINTHLFNSGKGDYFSETVDVTLNRDILINETDAINNAKASVGVLSDETILANHPWVISVDDEKKRIEAEAGSHQLNTQEGLPYE